jgi:hypothetical protein
MIKKFGIWAIIVGALLTIPFFANWPWDSEDYLVMGILLLVSGALAIFAWSKLGQYRYWGLAVVVLLFLWLWAELAVGVFTNWGS